MASLQTQSRLSVVNPSTEEEIAVLTRTGTADVDALVAAAAKGQEAWSETPPTQRALAMWRIAEWIDGAASELAELLTTEVGKPLRDANEDVAAASAYFRYYAGAADKLEGETIPLGSNYIDFNLLEPLGVTLHIVPWNYPTSLAARSLAPALAAGNAAIVKPSEIAPLAVRRLVEGAQRYLPAGLIHAVIGSGSQIGSYLVTHPAIGGITFTGSVDAGREVASLAGRHLKPVVTELGGKSPMLVFEDADLDRVVADVTRAVFRNAGQICSASSRLLVAADIRQEVVQRVADRARSLTVGPGGTDVDVGPLASKAQYDRVLGFISAGEREGAVVAAGGERPAGLEKGYFLSPTVFDAVLPSMSIATDEIFGPVVSTIQFTSEEEAVEIANGVRYGLVSAVYTRDIDRAFRIAKQLHAGQVWVNDWFVGGVQAPTGGYKDSGIGREKGLRALQNYVRVKNIGVRIGGVA